MAESMDDCFVLTSPDMLFKKEQFCSFVSNLLASNSILRGTQRAEAARLFYEEGIGWRSKTSKRLKPV